MPRTILWIAPLAAVLLVAGALLISGGGGPTPVASPSASSASAAPTTAAASPTPTPTPAGPSPYPIADGEPWIVLAGQDAATLIRPDGTGKHDILTDLSIGVFNPVWSPDGQRLAFEGNGDHGSHLWVANADGTDAHQVTATPDGCPDATCTEATHAAWSPDGASIAYMALTHVRGTFVENALTILDVATGTTTALYTTADALLARPTWSPDGASIAFEIDRYEGVPDVSAMTSSVIAVIATGSPNPVPKEITEPALLAGYPTWHPTDDLLVVRTNRLDTNTKTLLDSNAPSNLYTIRSDGTALTAVTDNAVGGAIVRAPSWTPDGRILFSKLANASTDEALRLIEVTGAGEVSATGDIVTVGEGRWRPGT